MALADVVETKRSGKWETLISEMLLQSPTLLSFPSATLGGELRSLTGNGKEVWIRSHGDGAGCHSDRATAWGRRETVPEKTEFNQRGYDG